MIEFILEQLPSLAQLPLIIIHFIIGGVLGYMAATIYDNSDRIKELEKEIKERK